MKEKEYVYIQSTMTIVVTPGLQNENVTNPDAHVPDRLRINPLWPKMRIMIKEGRHIYPKMIKDWPVVKNLIKDNILTVGEEVDNVEDKALIEKTNDIKTELKKIEDISLEKLVKEK